MSEAVDWLADDDVPPGVLIDLAAVTFAGSALLNFLARLSRRMPAGTELIVWRPSARASLVLRASSGRSAPRTTFLPAEQS
ncbi:hypothetical protein GCM10020369_31550 [Cryptosporangium minutisporangium]|uniref:STAS domain-containing protein n=1 Tax=Cryptosporangium minutisporangium TaxID=113569 RepID=A0ABP6SXA4_9ACTN